MIPSLIILQNAIPGNHLHREITDVLKVKPLRKGEDGEIQALPSVIPRNDSSKDNWNIHMDHSSSLDGNTEDRSNQDVSADNGKSSLCDPLPTEQLG